MNLPGRAWTRTARIHRILNNSSSLAEFDDPKTLAGYFDREVMPRKPNAIMLSGMLTRHTYYGQEDATLARIGRIVAEAHRRGLKVIDHFDWRRNIDFSGVRTLKAERLEGGRRRFTIPRDWLKAYLFVRIPATPGRLKEAPLPRPDGLKVRRPQRCAAVCLWRLL